MSNKSSLKEGAEVFRRHNPGRCGVLTGRSRPRGDDVYYQVNFQGKTEYVPDFELEEVDTDPLDQFQLIDQRRFGKASDLRRNLTHMQLSGKMSSLIYSMDATNTDFYPHQFKPVLAFLESPTNGMLIADEVGLGKTIEAGLLWTELRARYDYRRVLVVCPAMLCEKWCDELRIRFGIDAVTMDAAELLSELKRPTERLPDGKGIICSLQTIRPRGNWKYDERQPGIRNELLDFLKYQSERSPIIDLVIIDEAHYLRNRSSQSAHLARMLRDISKNILLLSATPINLKDDDLFNLLNIVDQDTFDVPDFFPQVLQANEPLLRARDLALDTSVDAAEIRRSLEEAAKYNVLSDNTQLQHLISTLKNPDSVADESNRVRLADRIERVNLLCHVVSRTRKADVIEWKVVRKPKSQFVELDENGTERNFYDAVTKAIREYAHEAGINEGFLLDSPQRQVSSCMYAAAKSWSNKANYANKDLFKKMIYEDIGLDEDFTPDISPLIDHLTSTVVPHVDLNQLRENDSKFNTFYHGIKEYLNKHPKEKIVVFSYFRATLYYLEERLTEKNIVCQVLVGDMKESKQAVINRFQNQPEIKVLLSSEVASEGVDLQFCRVVVNYDLPWNPMKIEQRIGRLDRIGQQAESIDIWNLGYADTIDQRIHERLFLRLKIFERALGGMEAILGKEIKKLTSDLFSHELTPEQQENRISQTAIAIENIKREEERLENDAASLIAHSGYILKQVQTAHKLKKVITEDDLIVYVEDYLNKHSPGHEYHQLESEKPVFNITLPQATAAKFSDYIERKNLHGKTRLAEGIQVKCEFASKISAPIGTVEKINQFHPLIRFISKEIEKQVFFPVVAVKLQNKKNIGWSQSDNFPNGQYAFAVEKWLFFGLREEEDIKVRAIHIESGEELDLESSWRLLNAVRLDGADWPEASAEMRPSLTEKILACYDMLNGDFTAVRQDKEIENQDRVNLQIHSAKKHRDRHVNSLKGVLENHISRNQTKMIPPTQGRIENTQRRFGIQIEKFKMKSSMDSDHQQICCGIILLS